MSQLLHCGGQGGWGHSRRGGRPANTYDWKYRCANRGYGRGVVFELPSTFQDLDAAALLEELEDDSDATGAEAERRLSQRIEENSQRLDLPPAALVTDRKRRGDVASGDLLDILTVLAKSSGRIFLRSKTPNIESITDKRRVVVIVPSPKSVRKRRS